jgi:hypothetical protein
VVVVGVSDTRLIDREGCDLAGGKVVISRWLLVLHFLGCFDFAVFSFMCLIPPRSRFISSRSRLS